MENIMIVPKGLSPYFYFFCEVFAGQHHATLVCDRRVCDRRVGRGRYFVNRRSGNRRGPEPSSWRAGDFIWLSADVRSKG